MAKYATLKAAIDETITTNGNYEISGEDVRNTLKSIIDSLGANYQLVGVATPATDPGTPDQNVAYLAGPGTYPNFGSTTIKPHQIGVFKYNGIWNYSSVDIVGFYININEIANHPAAYADAATALADVPVAYRKTGVKVVYLDDVQQLWIEMLCVDDAGVNWWTDVVNNWVIEGPIETDVLTPTGGKQLIIGGVKKGNLDDVLNVNVWNEQATEYATQAAARAAVPANKRKLGLEIIYLLDNVGWVKDQFIGDDFTDWDVADNWKVIGPVTVEDLEKSVNANDLTDNSIVNKLVKYMYFTRPESYVNYDGVHDLFIAVLSGSSYYNQLRLRRSNGNMTVIFSESFSTESAALSALTSNPIRVTEFGTVVFNPKEILKSYDLSFKFINRPARNDDNPIFGGYFKSGAFNKDFGNILVKELYLFPPTGYNLQYITLVKLFTLNSDNNKYEIRIVARFINSGQTVLDADIVNLTGDTGFSTKQDALDYWNTNIAGQTTLIKGGYGYIYFNKIINIENLPNTVSGVEFYPLKDFTNDENAPSICSHILSLNNIFKKYYILNHLFDEVYLNIDLTTLTSIWVRIGVNVDTSYRNLIYIYRTGLSTLVLHDATYSTFAEAMAAFRGIIGRDDVGYVKVNDRFADSLIQPIDYEPTSEYINKDRLKLKNCPIISDFLIPKNVLYQKSVVWEGDSIAAGNVYGNEAWRIPIEQKYGMVGVNYSVGGSTITCNIDSLTDADNIAYRIDNEVAANPNMKYFIFDGGTNDADRIGRIVHYVSGSNQTKTERNTPENMPAKFGTWSERDFSGNYDKDTFCGALEYVIWKVMSSCKGVKIGYIVAPKMGYTVSPTDPDYSGLTYFNRREYFRVAIEICKKWGVPVINLWEDSWMNPNMPNQYDYTKTVAENVAAGNYYADQQHPAPVGYNYLSKLIGEWMNDL